MADRLVHSPSPRSSYGGATGAAPAHGLHHATPAHSTHNSLHSLRSSTSSRTPHSLSLHEYRKLQNTPAPQCDTPPGKTLRRKAAASALNELKRVPSSRRSSSTLSHLVPRPLHLSLSAHQLTAHQPLPPSPPHLDEKVNVSGKDFRSQSAEPALLRDSVAGFSFNSDKVSNFKPIKRLPHPLCPQPPPLVSVASLPHLCATPTTSTGNAPSSAAQATPSSISLSRFPQPPELVNISQSPGDNRKVPPPLFTSITAAGPATPPATPAVIHYRGASFDLVNPHDSLLFHDIETPSRDLDSTDYSPLRSSEEPLLKVEMAPRRALYNDLDAAYFSIRGREDAPSNSAMANSPLPPVPAYLSPQSSAYSSPIEAYDFSLAVSPLAVKKEREDSRFSLKDLTPIKQLTRSFTRKLAKPAQPVETELHVFGDTPTASPVVGHFEGQYPRPLDESYPTTFTSPEGQHAQHASYFSEEERSQSSRWVISTPLASMVPDDPSSEAGRGQKQSVSTSGVNTRGYYEEVESLYPSSSIYEGDAEGRKAASMYSARASRTYGASDYGEAVTSPYPRESVYSYSFSNTDRASRYAPSVAHRSSTRFSRPLTTDFLRRSQFATIENTENTENTDTISKFIDQYEGREPTDSSLHNTDEDITQTDPFNAMSGNNQFEYQRDTSHQDERGEPLFVTAIRDERSRKRTIARFPGPPPQYVAPLEPAFEYDEISPSRKESDAFSPASSYGDTRNLLQYSQDGHVGNLERSSVFSSPAPGLPAGSSSYSQNESIQTHAQTPKEALDQAQQIFEQAEDFEGIPAIWSRHSSGNLLRTRSKRSITAEENEVKSDGWETPAEHSCYALEEDQGDWETVGDKSRHSAVAVGGITGYNPSEDRSARTSVYGTALYNMPANLRRGSSPDLYRHPGRISLGPSPSDSPLPAMGDAVSSAPISSNATPCPRQILPAEASETALMPPQAARTFYDRPYFFVQDSAPWTREIASPYALSDKETQELLNSGPNDDIVYEDAQGNRHSRLQSTHDAEASDKSERISHTSKDNGVVSLSPLHEGYNNAVLGQPRKHEAGISIINRSNPPAASASNACNNEQRRVGFSGRSSHAGFYAEPGQTFSINLIHPALRQEAVAAKDKQPPRPSSGTLSNAESAPNRSSSMSGRAPSRRSVSDGRMHRHGRSAVAGQTKLREMVLSPGTASSIRTHSTHFSDFMRNDRPPSTAHTEAPLRPGPSAIGQKRSRRSTFSVLTPHLRNPERPLDPNEEAQRSKLSWIIFGIFCIMPPLVILYRWFADPLVAWLTNGRLGSASITPKRVALWAGAPLNILIVVAIIVPIIVVSK